MWKNKNTYLRRFHLLYPRSLSLALCLNFIFQKTSHANISSKNNASLQSCMLIGFVCLLYVYILLVFQLFQDKGTQFKFFSSIKIKCFLIKRS